ncbi:hypothetical protein RvY_03233-2 [Ramazzottius varieornatus]|uniref:BZIP domain-containing protein n=1 Tax=Ramazzottius varieornatus TaxID=947166 RepID=A0A1D1UME1_RAMVA|nr:hypothetical protein RvY_03233-2 [Ramazzottius varieornatus]
MDLPSIGIAKCWQYGTNSLLSSSDLRQTSDLDVQRLVDVLWSQDVDLGVGRESFEYPLRAATSLPLEKPLSETSFKETVLSEAAFRDSHSLDNGNFYVDEETGELIPKSLPSLPLTSTLSKKSLPSMTHSEGCKESEASFECFDYLSSQAYQAEEGSALPHLQAANGSDVEAAQLQSLINALDSLNSSTLQAVIDQGISPDVKVLEEQWGDVESIISAGANSLFLQNAGLDGLERGTGMAEAASVSPHNVENASTSLRDFDLFSVLMEPAVNWTLSSATLPSAPYTADDYGAKGPSVSTMLSQANGTMGSQGVASDFGALANQENGGQVYPYFIPLSSGRLPPSSLPLLNHSNMLEWNMTDWSNSTFSTVSTLNPNTAMLDRSNDWKFSDLLAKLEAPTGHTEVVSMTQPALKVERQEGEGWTERAAMAVSLNHSYANPAPPPLPPAARTPTPRRRQSLQSREGSEADGSTGSDPFSVSGGRSRSSRDERAALEAGLPLTAAEIIRMPVEEFNGYISGQVGQLRPEQIQMMKDIRRRGKNKVAAQNCRKRKIDNMSHLEREIMGIREELKRESQRRDELIRERDLHRVALARIPVIQPTSVAPQSSSSTTGPAPVITRSSHGHVPSSVMAKERVAKPIRKRKQPEEQ